MSSLIRPAAVRRGRIAAGVAAPRSTSVPRRPTTARAGKPPERQPGSTAAEPDPRLAGRRAAGEHGAVPDRGHDGHRRLLDAGVPGLRPAGAEGRLPVDPGRSDRGERVR